MISRGPVVVEQLWVVPCSLHCTDCVPSLAHAERRHRRPARRRWESAGADPARGPARPRPPRPRGLLAACSGSADPAPASATATSPPPDLAAEVAAEESALSPRTTPCSRARPGSTRRRPRCSPRSATSTPSTGTPSAPRPPPHPPPPPRRRAAHGGGRPRRPDRRRAGGGPEQGAGVRGGRRCGARPAADVHRRLGGVARAGAARPARGGRMTPLEAWTAVVAGEDAAVYAYSVAGGRVSGGARRRALAGLDAHRASRSRAAACGDRRRGHRSPGRRRLRPARRRRDAAGRPRSHGGRRHRPRRHVRRRGGRLGRRRPPVGRTHGGRLRRPGGRVGQRAPAFPSRA